MCISWISQPQWVLRILLSPTNRIAIIFRRITDPLGCIGDGARQARGGVANGFAEAANLIAKQLN